MGPGRALFSVLTSAYYAAILRAFFRVISSSAWSQSSSSWSLSLPRASYSSYARRRIWYSSSNSCSSLVPVVGCFFVASPEHVPSQFPKIATGPLFSRGHERTLFGRSHLSCQNPLYVGLAGDDRRVAIHTLACADARVSTQIRALI
jgi:hypothetical protein